MKSIRKAGFTLIEVLVTVVVIGVLAAVVIPAVTAQVTAGDSARVISDLDNIRTGIENFDIAVRQFPGDVDDLVNRPGILVSSTSQGTDVDADVFGALYASPAIWSGPYVEATLPVAATSSTLPSPSSTAAFTTGYAGTINNQFFTCAITAVNSCQSASPDYEVVRIDNLTAAQAATINNLIDGVGEASSTLLGRFRNSTANASGTVAAFYYATPIK